MPGEENTHKSAAMPDHEFEKHVIDAAGEFISRYGTDAARQAARRSEELLAAGEHEGHQLWSQIYHAITVLNDNATDRSKH